MRRPAAGCGDDGDGQSAVQAADLNAALETHTLPQEDNSAPKMKSGPGSASSLAQILKQAQPTPASVNAFGSSSDAAPTSKRAFSVFEADNNKQNGLADSQPPAGNHVQRLGSALRAHIRRQLRTKTMTIRHQRHPTSTWWTRQATMTRTSRMTSL